MPKLHSRVSHSATIAGVDLTPPKDPPIHTSPRAAMAKLQRLHAAARRLAEGAPEIIANPNAAGGLEQELIEAIANCLAYGEKREHSLAQRQHTIVMRRFHRVVEEPPGAAALHPGNLQGYRGFAADIANVLPGVSGDGAKTLPGAAPHGFGAAGVALGGA